MDVLNNLPSLAEANSLLQPLGGPRGIPHRLSLYADDAALFLTPVASDLMAIRSILLIFGETTGLHTKLAKSSISPIHGSDEHLRLIDHELQCSTADFPCKYLGLPLTLTKPT